MVTYYVLDALNDPQNNIAYMRLLVPIESEYRNILNSDYQIYMNEKYVKGNVFSDFNSGKYLIGWNTSTYAGGF